METTDTVYKKAKHRRMWRIAVLIVAVVAISWVFWRLSSALQRFSGEGPVWVYLPEGSDAGVVGDSLRAALGDGFGGCVASMWNGDTAVAPGAYRIEHGDRAWSVVRRIETGRQTPVRVTFNNIRTVDQLADRIASKMGFSSELFLEALDKAATDNSVSREAVFAEFMPDTYEFFWTAKPETVIGKIRDNYASFWTSERVGQAKTLGLTPLDVSILASIVEEETVKSDERPVVARLYLNRLSKGMKLQADPTVKYAVGDFSIRRITGDMLKTSSPYNTYRITGLPPGPIRLPEKKTLDAVLNAPQNDYIYMCARSDFSGYHDFSNDYSAHIRNASAYRAALNRRGIK